MMIASLILLSLLSSSFVVKNAHAALATAPYTTAELNAKLYGGVQQAIDWDKACYDGMVANRNAGMPARTAINEAPSYRSLQWMSLADTSTQNNSSRTAPIIVNYGTKSVPLQLNMIQFICAALVSPDGAGDTFSYNDQRVVRSLNNANDRAPNPMGGGDNWPARTDSRFRIDKMQVTQGNGHITGAAVGQYISTARQNNTRYWFASPVGFNFVANSPNGLTADTIVKIRFTLRGFNTYYYNTYQCYANSLYQTDPFNINRCDENDVTLSIAINIRYNYNITPTAGLGGQTSIEPSGTANVSNVVTKAAGGTDTAPTDWRLTELDYAPGTTLTAADIAARDSATDPCGAFIATQRTVCKDAERNPTAVFKNATTTYSPSYGYVAPNNLAPGTKICFVSSVSAPTQSAAPVWRHSAMVCMVAAKKPKVQFQGSDVAVGGNIETSVSLAGTAPAKMYGSWVEYGAFAVGTSTGFASGSGYAGGTIAPTDQLNRLTFANVDNAGGNSYGHYTLPAATTLLSDQFASASSIGVPTSNLGSLNSGTYKTTDLTINASDIGQDGANRGKSIIIVASGTVKIVGDINYKGPGGGDSFSSPSQLPQVVIIANKIDIAGSVGQVDAWLLTTGADGSVNTCSDRLPSDPLNAGVCNKKLTVSGPVSTQHLYLRRTGGSDIAGDSAELFNLRPDAYIWAYLQASQNGKAETVYSVELPPRF